MEREKITLAGVCGEAGLRETPTAEGVIPEILKIYLTRVKWLLQTNNTKKAPI